MREPSQLSDSDTDPDPLPETPRQFQPPGDKQTRHVISLTFKLCSW